MRTAEICPTCAVYQNAECIIYNGKYLANAVVNPGDNLQDALYNINVNLVPSYSTSTPSSPAPYVGKIHVDQSTNGKVYVASLAGTASDWEVVVTVPEVGAPEYANNSAALLAGLSVGEIYRTGDILKIVH